MAVFGGPQPVESLNVRRAVNECAVHCQRASVIVSAADSRVADRRSVHARATYATAAAILADYSSDSSLST